MMKEAWDKYSVYDQYVGKWSRLVAVEFLSWLGASSSQIWGDVGCGTGALVECILALPGTKSVMAVDQSKSYLDGAHSKVGDKRAHFAVADALAIPWVASSLDTTVSGLVLNFVPNAERMVREMARVTRPGGRIAVYVWDYSGGMELMRYFWDAVVELNPEDATFDAAIRFPLCQPKPLRALFQKSGLSAVSLTEISIATAFHNFDDYWQFFLGRQGSASAYLTRLEDPKRDLLRERLRERIVPAADGTITLSARAWAVQGRVPPSAEGSYVGQ